MSEQQCTYCGFADPLLYQGGDDRYYCDDVDECRERAGAYIATLQRELAVLRGAIEKTLRENGHLADGDNCTLIDLKQALAGQPAPSAAQIDDAISGTRVDVAPQPLGGSDNG